MTFFSIGQLRKKINWTNLFSFITAQTEENLLKKLVKISDEFVKSRRGMALLDQQISERSWSRKRSLQVRKSTHERATTPDQKRQRLAERRI